MPISSRRWESYSNRPSTTRIETNLLLTLLSFNFLLHSRLYTLVLPQCLPFANRLPLSPLTIRRTTLKMETKIIPLLPIPETVKTLLRLPIALARSPRPHATSLTHSTNSLHGVPRYAVGSEKASVHSLESIQHLPLPSCPTTKTRTIRLTLPQVQQWAIRSVECASSTIPLLFLLTFKMEEIRAAWCTR